MTTLARFPSALGDWIEQQLERGWDADALVRAMEERGVAGDASRAIVSAFVNARALGSPRPVDAVELIEAPRLPRGTSIRTGDRTVRVATRIDRPVLAVLNDVLDADECAELIELARPRLQPSTIVDPRSGRDVVTGLRASSGMFFHPFRWAGQASDASGTGRLRAPRTSRSHVMHCSRRGASCRSGRHCVRYRSAVSNCPRSRA